MEKLEAYMDKRFDWTNEGGPSKRSSVKSKLSIPKKSDREKEKLKPPSTKNVISPQEVSIKDTESKFGSIKQESIIEPVTDRSIPPVIVVEEKPEKSREIFKVEIVEPI